MQVCRPASFLNPLNPAAATSGRRPPTQLTARTTSHPRWLRRSVGHGRRHNLWRPRTKSGPGAHTFAGTTCVEPPRDARPAHSFEFPYHTPQNDEAPGGSARGLVSFETCPGRLPEPAFRAVEGRLYKFSSNPDARQSFPVKGRTPIGQFHGARKGTAGCRIWVISFGVGFMIPRSLPGSFVLSSITKAGTEACAGWRKLSCAPLGGSPHPRRGAIRGKCAEASQPTGVPTQGRA